MHVRFLSSWSPSRSGFLCPWYGCGGFYALLFVFAFATVLLIVLPLFSEPGASR